jgi:transcription antitermination factor NusG
MAFWTAAQIKSDQVKRAVWHIQRQQFEVYLPLCRVSRRSTRVVPVFVGYLFVRVVDRWHCLNGTYGVIRVVCSGGVPAVVREHEIARMRDQEDKSGIIVLPLTKFQPGEKVRVTRGPLAERAGIYAGMSARDRVRIMFTMFERQVQIELREQDVISAA